MGAFLFFLLLRQMEQFTVHIHFLASIACEIKTLFAAHNKYSCFTF
ncbi:hypothetical protein BC059799_3194 [Bacillus cereus NVH0597-99]|nr:hypothetical protein BC059799_3194 [Bacillus cereus NVH0597-99]